MSNEIDLNNLPGKSLVHKLLQYFKINADLKKTFHITTPAVFPSEEQRGENCKLKALSDAILHNAIQHNTKRIALYKAKTYGISLRQLAKQNGSVVGEVYSLEMLRQTCFDAGYESAVCAPQNTDDYVKELENLVDRNLAPIVFFDMDLSKKRHGLPYIGDGSNEHASVVLGYYRNTSDETHFIVTQWGRYYDFDGMELALSSLHSLKEKREVETFTKRINSHTNSSLWVLKSKDYDGYMPLEHVEERTAIEMRDSDTPLKGKIMVVTSMRSGKYTYR